MKVTLLDIAQQAKVSLTTASRGLAGYSDVSPATRAKVQSIAQALGYVPNVAAKNLVLGRTDYVGFITSPLGGGIRVPFLGEFLNHFSHALLQNNRHLVIGVAEDGEVLDVLRKFITGRRCDALAINRITIDDPRLLLLRQSGTPFVCYGRDLTDCADYHWVDSDGHKAFDFAVDMLHQLGHRCFALLSPDLRFAYAQDRRNGFIHALAMRGLTGHVHEFLQTDTELAQQQLTHLLQSSNRPTALLCATDELAFSVMHVAARLGLSIPQDLSVVGFDNLRASRLTNPALSTFDPQTESAAQKIATLLDAQLQTTATAPAHALLDAVWLPRGSHGQAPPL